jgi:predicted RNA binding protein YcfA (HicA-like mRNA interferase family)
MSPRLPRITPAQLLRALHHDGWYEHAQEGSHLTLKHPTKTGRLVVPIHAGKVLKPGLLARILDDAKLTADELRRLL